MIAALVTALSAAAVVLLALRTLSLRLVGAQPRPHRVTAQISGEDAVVLPRSPKSEFLGAESPVLRYGADLKNHATLGPIVAADKRTVTRELSRLSAPINPGRLHGVVASYAPREASSFRASIVDVDVSSDPSMPLPAWFVGGSSSHWTIHVQGLRTSRDVTIRSMIETVACGSPTLSVTFRGAGELPGDGRSSLGQDEWRDLREALRYARNHGAQQVSLVGWSMGAGIALELARRAPEEVDGLILIAPATAWVPIARHGSSAAGLPAWVGGAASAFLRTRFGSFMCGMRSPLNIHALRWDRPGDLAIPAVVLHSRGDNEIPFELSEAFARAHAGLVRLIEFPPSPHAWEALADPELFRSTFHTYLRMKS